ncbi:ferrochelatase [Candidatus Cyanaurora vandensis]|uniref:ferrochelatase n=1 Tax=Candidatus Cyanaurora vandensis TaxID=2714958 RepID=UPI00257F45FE|nr:ferrochelatase [Candidatus Cyanaurora vandensis]
MQDKRIAVLLVGYGEVEDYRNFATYNEMALRLLTAKFLQIPSFAYRWLGKILAGSDRREWGGQGNFQSPHNEIFEAQRAGLAEQLQERFGAQVQVFKAFNFCEPHLPEQVLAQIRAQGFRRVLIYPLLVVDSVFTSGLALQQVNAALAQEDRWLEEMRYIPSFFERPDYHQRLAGYVSDHLERISKTHQPSRIGLVLMNHGSPYKVKGFTTGIEESQALYERVRALLIQRYPLISIGWLNHETPGQWTIPDVEQASRNLLEVGASTLVYCPIGFVTENHETILDVGYITRRFEQKGIPCHRLDCLNADAEFLRLLADWSEPLVQDLLRAETPMSRPAYALPTSLESLT